MFFSVADVKNVCIILTRIHLVGRNFVARAHAAGKLVVYWTLNHPSEMAACLASGANGFFTDDVRMARAALVAAGLLQKSETQLKSFMSHKRICAFSNFRMC